MGMKELPEKLVLHLFTIDHTRTCDNFEKMFRVVQILRRFITANERTILHNTPETKYWRQWVSPSKLEQKLSEVDLLANKSMVTVFF